MKLNHLLSISESKLDDLNKDQVLELQTALNKIGYSVGTADGYMGVDTKRAWDLFKADTFQAKPDMIGSGTIKIIQDILKSIPTTINWKEGSCKISKHFSVLEVTKNDPKRIPTDPKVISNILKLAKELDKVRDDWGRPIGVTSWYRPAAVNKAVGGVSNSQHINGSAADIFLIDGNIFEFQSWLDKRWDKALGWGAKKGFVHCDLRPGRIRWNY